MDNSEQRALPRARGGAPSQLDGCGRKRKSLLRFGKIQSLMCHRPEDVSGEGKVFARVDRVQIRNLIGAFLEDWQRHVGKAFARRGTLPGTVKALYELQRTQKRYALVTMCIGGGQGIAAIFERV